MSMQYTKHKTDGRNTCRIAAMGTELPHTPAFSSVASVAYDDDKILAAVLMQANCEKRGDTLIIEDRDIVYRINYDVAKDKYWKVKMLEDRKSVEINELFIYHRENKKGGTKK